jgi:hypothetical protein
MKKNERTKYLKRTQGIMQAARKKTILKMNTEASITEEPDAEIPHSLSRCCLSGPGSE